MKFFVQLDKNGRYKRKVELYKLHTDVTDKLKYKRPCNLFGILTH